MPKAKNKISKKLPGLIEEKCSEFISSPYSDTLSSSLDILTVKEFLEFTLLNRELPLKRARREFLNTDCSGLFENLFTILSDLHAEGYFTTSKDRSVLMLGLLNISSMNYFLIEQQSESPEAFEDILRTSKESIAGLTSDLSGIKEEIQAELNASREKNKNKEGA